MTSELNKYEGMFLLHAGKLSSQEKTGVTIVTELLEKVEALVVRAEVWDERKLAYPIQDQKRGTYVLAHFESAGTAVDALHRNVNLNEDVMRLLVVRHKEGFPEFTTASDSEGGRRRDRDDRPDRSDKSGDKAEKAGDKAEKAAATEEAAPAAEAPAAEAPVETAAAPEAPAATESAEAPEATGGEESPKSDDPEKKD